MQEAVKKLCKAWNEGGTAVFLTGAGASTESGLNDFTGAGGVYEKASVKRILTRDFMLENPVIFNEYCRNRLYAPFAKPNKFHKALADWEETGLITAIITQNIDSLHQRSGSKKVLELHGNMQRVYCDTCKREAKSKQLYERANRKNKCPHCGGVIRPAILLYGEHIDKDVYSEALRLVENVPMLIVAGTRLKVTAPIDIIDHFKKKTGGIVAYIGNTPPDNCEFDIMVEGKLGEIVDEMKKYMF